MMVLPGGGKSFNIGLASRFDTIPACDGQTPSQPASQPGCRSKYRAYYVARVIKDSFFLKKVWSAVQYD